MRVLAGEDLGDRDALALTLVGKHRRTRDVSNCVNARSRRGHLRVDLDEAAFGELNTLLLEPDVLDVERAAGGDEHLFNIDGFLLTADLDCHRNCILADLDAADLRAGQHVDLPFLERPLELLRAITVLEGQNPR